MIHDIKIGMRVMTPKHGPGVIVEAEIISEIEPWGLRLVNQTITGRYAVKLDVPTWVGPLSYYFPKELEKSSLPLPTIEGK